MAKVEEGQVQQIWSERTLPTLWPGTKLPSPDAASRYASARQRHEVSLTGFVAMVGQKKGLPGSPTGIF